MKTAFDHRRAAMSLLTSGVELRPREGQFLGGIAFDANPLTDKQARWLSILLDKHRVVVGPKRITALETKQ